MNASERLVIEMLDEIMRRQFRTLYLLHTINRRDADMADRFDGLIAEVSELKTVDASAIAAINGLIARLDAAAGDPAKLASIVADMKANREALAAAISNIPADPGTGGGTTAAPATSGGEVAATPDAGGAQAAEGFRSTQT